MRTKLQTDRRTYGCSSHLRAKISALVKWLQNIPVQLRNSHITQGVKQNEKSVNSNTVKPPNLVWQSWPFGSGCNFTQRCRGTVLKQVQFWQSDKSHDSLLSRFQLTSFVSFSLLQFRLRIWGWILDRLLKLPGCWLSGGSRCPLGHHRPR